MSQQLVEDGQKIGKDISEKHVEIILTCEKINDYAHNRRNTNKNHTKVVFHLLD